MTNVLSPLCQRKESDKVLKNLRILKSITDDAETNSEGQKAEVKCQLKKRSTKKAMINK